MLVISYAPLLTSIANNTTITEENAQELINTIQESTKLGQSDGCIWLKDDERAVPVLIFENGNKIADHLKEWSEGNPKDWFTLFALETDDGFYHMFLMPRVDKSIKRHSTNHNIDMNGEQKVIFVPLAIRAKVSDFSRDCLNSLPDVVKFGIIDDEYTLFGDMAKLNFDKVVNWFEFDLRSVYDKTMFTSLIPLLDGANILRDYGPITMGTD